MEEIAIETQLNELKTSSFEQIDKTQTIHDLDQVKSYLLGKKSPIQDILKKIPTLPIQQRPLVGKQANVIKQEIHTYISKRRDMIIQLLRDTSINSDTTDVSLPNFGRQAGHYHPITLTTKKICDILSRLGFSIKQGPNIESDFYNFEALNIPADHPARDMHDTFYLRSKDVLRTHTSPVQIRTMLEKKPPIKIIAPGKVYRCDADVSHSPVFHQIEGLYVNEGVTFADLKGTLEFFLRELFGKDKAIRFRSSYFPFTEPSVEIDVEYTINGKTTWLEIMGAGMVQHAVFDHVKYNTEELSGFAFGLGVERVAMILHAIDDIRLFYENDKRFISQF